MFENGKGRIENVSIKQKINTDRSTIAELVGLHDALPLVVSTKLFLEEQGYKQQQDCVRLSIIIIIIIRKSIYIYIYTCDKIKRKKRKN